MSSSGSTRWWRRRQVTALARRFGAAVATLTVAATIITVPAAPAQASSLCDWLPGPNLVDRGCKVVNLTSSGVYISNQWGDGSRTAMEGNSNDPYNWTQPPAASNFSLLAPRNGGNSSRSTYFDTDAFFASPGCYTKAAIFTFNAAPPFEVRNVVVLGYNRVQSSTGVWQRIDHNQDAYVLGMDCNFPPADPHVSQSDPPTISVVGTTPTTVTLSWKVHLGMDYEVFRNGSRVGSGGGVYTDTGLTPGTTYSYLVREIDTYGGKVTAGPAYATTLFSGSGSLPPQSGGTPTGGYVAAFQANTGNLWSSGTSGVRDWGQGMAPGTSPSVAGLTGGRTEVAFQANTTELITVGDAAWTNWGLGMMPGTSPSITGLTGGGWEVAFQANSGNLWTIGTAGWLDWGLGLMPGTSPSITGLSGGGFQVAFQANSGNLWIAGDNGFGDQGLGMAPGTSPSITALPGNGYQIAFQANTTNLWTTGTTGVTDWGQGMAPGTSPSITTIPGVGQEIAFQANTTEMVTVGDATWANWGLGMMPGTSPSITALSTGGFEVAFQANTGHLWYVGGYNWEDSGMVMMPGTSPASTRF